MKHPLDTNVVMLAELTIDAAQRDRFLDYTVENLGLSRSAAGNIAFDILIDEARPERVLFTEVWESREAQQAYMAWRVQRGDLTTLTAFLPGPPAFSALCRIAV